MLGFNIEASIEFTPQEIDAIQGGVGLIIEVRFDLFLLIDEAREKVEMNHGVLEPISFTRDEMGILERALAEGGEGQYRPILGKIELNKTHINANGASSYHEISRVTFTDKENFEVGSALNFMRIFEEDMVEDLNRILEKFDSTKGGEIMFSIGELWGMDEALYVLNSYAEDSLEEYEEEREEYDGLPSIAAVKSAIKKLNREKMEG